MQLPLPLSISMVVVSVLSLKKKNRPSVGALRRISDILRRDTSSLTKILYHLRAPNSRSENSLGVIFVQKHKGGMIKWENFRT